MRLARSECDILWIEARTCHINAPGGVAIPLQRSFRENPKLKAICTPQTTHIQRAEHHLDSTYTVHLKGELHSTLGVSLYQNRRVASKKTQQKYRHRRQRHYQYTGAIQVHFEQTRTQHNSRCGVIGGRYTTKADRRTKKTPKEKLEFKKWENARLSISMRPRTPRQVDFWKHSRIIRCGRSSC